VSALPSHMQRCEQATPLLMQGCKPTTCDCWYIAGTSQHLGLTPKQAACMAACIKTTEVRRDYDAAACC
jgi:hypothetical protein